MPTSPATPSRSDMKRLGLISGGFTLVEMVVVMAIISVSTWVVAVNLDALAPEAAIEAEAQKLAATLRFGMTQDRRSSTAVYDFQAQSYCLEVPEVTAPGMPSATARLFERRLPSQLRLEQIYVPSDGHSVSTGEMRYPLRLGDDSGVHYVYLRHTATHSLRILEVVPTVGEVFVHADDVSLDISK